MIALQVRVRALLAVLLDQPDVDDVLAPSESSESESEGGEPNGTLEESDPVCLYDLHLHRARSAPVSYIMFSTGAKACYFYL